MQLTESELRVQQNQLCELVEQVMEPHKAAAYNRLLRELRDDPRDNTDAYYLLGMERAPAAQGNHHNFEGGLIYHYHEMWDTWLHMRGGLVQHDEHVTDERVLCGIINHDIHKGWRTYRLESVDPWQVQYAEDQTDKLLSKDYRRPQGTFKNLFILQKHQVPLDEIDYNVILNAEGGWSKTQTYWCTVVAKLCYLLDEMSGNVMGRQASGRWLGHNQKVEAPDAEEGSPTASPEAATGMAEAD